MSKIGSSFVTKLLTVKSVRLTCFEKDEKLIKKCIKS